MDLKISKHLVKGNLHHAYLIEGSNDDLLPKILNSLKDIGVETKANPDIYRISLDVFKINDAREISTVSTLKGFSENKKIFIIYANNFLVEAQNAMLKIFEEPKENTHFFVITPNITSLIPTFISRFYLIENQHKSTYIKDAQKFISMNLENRIKFIKELLTEDDTGNQIDFSIESTRFKSLNFLNSLEEVLHKNFIDKKNTEINLFNQLFKTRENLQHPSSSIKNLMEAMAICIPEVVPST